MITVSIVTFHTAIEELQKCLQSLTSSHIECIFIIDNSQEDYIRAFCATQPKVEYIPQDNIGYGAAHNIAIAKSIARHATYHWYSTAMFILHPIALTLSKAIWMSIPMWGN